MEAGWWHVPQKRRSRSRSTERRSLCGAGTKVELGGGRADGTPASQVSEKGRRKSRKAAEILTANERGGAGGLNGRAGGEECERGANGRERR